VVGRAEQRPLGDRRPGRALLNAEQDLDALVVGGQERDAEEAALVAPEERVGDGVLLLERRVEQPALGW
jgi:hypothetical protein